MSSISIVVIVMCNQQNYGSQQHLADHFQQQRPLQHQQNFGSSPHLAQVFSPSMNTYNSRPPSRDPYQQMQQHQQQQQPPMPMQFINEQSQYMSPQQQVPPMMQQPPHYMQNMYGGGGGGGDNSHNYNAYGSPQYMSHHSQPPPPQQQQQQPYMSRPASVYDDYASPPYHGRDLNSTHPNHFYLHETASPAPSQRRTWAHSAFEQQQQQQQQQSMVDINAWQASKKSAPAPQMAYNNNNNNANHHQGFRLHQNGDGGEFQHLFDVQSTPQHARRPPGQQGAMNVQRQQSLTNLRDNRSPNSIIRPKAGGALDAQLPDEMMAPQSICFIGDEEDVDDIEQNIIDTMRATRIADAYNHPQPQQYAGRGSSSEEYGSNEIIPQKLNITSGNLTYRIPSPSRPQLQANNFQDPREKTNEKGFYISFDDEQPKRPKPPLRAKRSPKKEHSLDNGDVVVVEPLQTKRESQSKLYKDSISNDSYNSPTEAKPRNNVNNFNGNNIGRAVENKNATYNKYNSSPPLNLRQLSVTGETNAEHRHLEDITNQPLSPTNHQNSTRQFNEQNAENKNKALVIGNEMVDPESVDEMERRKEKIMLLSLQRRQQQEEAKARKEIEAQQKREREREKEDERARKKEEQVARRAAILEQHRLKKAIEEAEREGKTIDRSELNMKSHSQNSAAVPRLRQQRIIRPRPKTIHVDDGSVDVSEASSISSRSKKGSSTNLTGFGQLSSTSMRRDYYRGSQDSLSVKDSGLGRATPPRRAPSPGMAASGRLMPSPSGPGSLPPGLISKRRIFDDGANDGSAGYSMEYSGPKLYKQPAAKSNRGIILNAVEYCVFPGAVNREAKQKVLEKIARSEAKHFLVLFRDAGCQFRALYSYIPDADQVCKLYGTGPSQVDEVMFDKFFKYNSGGKCFSQVHTKHLTVTIDAFTIHNSLWQGKKVNLPSKKDMALVI